MMKKILVVSYSQSGQLNEIVDSILSPIRKSDNAQITFLEIKPKKDYPFPWNGYNFFDVFPESFLQEKIELDLPEINESENFDLVLLAYQVWYLSPSIPFNSFLHSDLAKKILNNKNVITIIGARNMWFNAQEIVKKRLKKIKANLCGNIVLTDKTNNIISGITILYWMLIGKKKSFLKYFPKPGVSENDINDASRFGKVILGNLEQERFDNMQHDLLKTGSVQIIPDLMLLEKRAVKIFRLWSNLFIICKNKNKIYRKILVKFFTLDLFIAFFIFVPFLLHPIIKITKLLSKNKILNDIDYFSGTELKE